MEMIKMKWFGKWINGASLVLIPIRVNVGKSYYFGFLTNSSSVYRKITSTSK